MRSHLEGWSQHSQPSAKGSFKAGALGLKEKPSGNPTEIRSLQTPEGPTTVALEDKELSGRGTMLPPTGVCEAK